MTRLLLVDDHVSFRQSLAFVFGHEPGFTVVAQAGSVAEARGRLADADVAIVDIDLPDGSGVEIVREIRATNSRCMALVLTGSASNRQLAAAVEAGANGIMYKTALVDEIIDAVRRLGAGEQLLAPAEIVQLLRIASRNHEQVGAGQRALASLTARECEVLQALADGITDKEMALRFQISIETARNHMARILRKLGVESRLQALIFALRHGAIQLE